jgi:hypothetical protein
MSDARSEPQISSDQTATERDIGGLRFAVSFRGGAGATLRVYGPAGGAPKELIRFDDFVDEPHYHVPADGPPIGFDRALGEPLDWFVAQLRDHLGDMLMTAGFADVLGFVDLGAVAADAGTIRKMMEACVPAGYVRAPGVGLQRAEA